MSKRLNGWLPPLACLIAVAAVAAISIGVTRAPRPDDAPPRVGLVPESPDEGEGEGDDPEGMIWIPPGVVVIGDTEDDLRGLFRRIEKKNPPSDYWTTLARPHERMKSVPKGFFIDRTEVTNRAYAEFLLATGGRPPAVAIDAERDFTDWHAGNVIPGREDHPVFGVTAFEAEAYARWVGKRLPTEIEWEYAARGDDERTYPWGDEWKDDRANTALAGENDSARVGSYPRGASPFGVLDMCGNVWEWTASEFGLYPGNERRTGNEGQRTIKGGGFVQVPAAARCSVRIGIPPTFRTNMLGFRCVRDGDN
jgi:formylglycine-generating enzyme required for sulfatase activity